MAKKIRTFQDYDAARRERELNLPQAVQSRLEELMLRNIRKNTRELGLGVKVFEISLAHSIDAIRALSRGPEGMMRLYVKQQTERHTPQAEQEAQLEYFQQNMRELIGCGVLLSKPHTSLDENQKQSFYARFLDNVKEFTDSKHFLPFKTKYPGVEDLVRDFRPPEKGEEKFEQMVSVTEGLCRERYITRENADTIVGLLSPRAEIQDFPVRTARARGRTPAPIPESALIALEDKSTREERLEYLTMVLRLPREIAQSYANQITLQQLDELHQGMNDAVGDEYTFKIIQVNHRVITYPSENILTKYLTTLQVVQGRIRSNGDKEELEKKFGIKNNVQKYASLEQLLELKRQLFQETGQYHPTTLEESSAKNFQVYVSRYALLTDIPKVTAFFKF